MCVGFQFGNEGLIFYHSVRAVREVSLQYKAFKFGDLVVQFVEVLAIGSHLLLSLVLFCDYS